MADGRWSRSGRRSAMGVTTRTREVLASVSLTGVLLIAAGAAVLAQDASQAPGSSGTALSPTGPSPTATWSPSWSPAPPSASDRIIRDEFEETGPWWTGSDEVGSSSIAGDAMHWTIDQKHRSIWDSVELPTVLDRVRVDASVLVDEGSGGGGPLCAGSDVGERALWAGINGDGEWLVGRIADTHLQVIDRGEIPFVRRHDVPSGAPYPLLVTLECTSDPLDGDRATVWVSGIQVADVVDDPVGPYQRVGLVASGDTPPFAMTFEDFEVFGPEGPASGVPAAGPTSTTSPGP